MAQSQLDTLIKQYDLLSDIRDTLSSSQPNFDYLAGVISQLDTNTQDISNLLAEYLDYQAKQSASNFTASQVSTAAETTIVQGTTQQSRHRRRTQRQARLQRHIWKRWLRRPMRVMPPPNEKLDKIYQAINDLTIAIKAA